MAMASRRTVRKRLPPRGTEAYWRELERRVDALLKDRERRLKVWRWSVGGRP